MKAFKISAPQWAHQVFYSLRQNSSPSPYPPSYSPRSEHRELRGAGRISGNAVVGKRFRQGLRKEEAWMQEGCWVL